MTEIPTTGLQLRSLVDADGTLHLSLQTVEVPTPGENEVLVRVDAAPINPSDLGLLFAGADMAAASFDGSGPASTVTATIAPGALKAMAGRVGESMPVGNEGGGVVVAAGSAPAAQALLGKTVGLLGGAMYSQYRCVDVSQCLELPDGRHRGRGGGVLRQPAHRARPRRHDAPRGPHRPGAHRGRVEPRPDAEPAVHRRRHPAREHRAIATACGAAARRRAPSTSATRRPSRSWTT